MSERHRLHRLRAQLDIYRADRATVGPRVALVRRIRHFLDLEPVTERIDDLSDELAELVREGRVRVPGAFERVWTTTRWLESLDVPTDVRVSVIIPTRGTRPDGLRHAVASVVGQSYPNWELLVVVDGEDDGSIATSMPDDARVRVLMSRGSGVSAAHNTGLDHATGAMVAYCDDDNTMGPHWLKAVAWSSARHPDAEVFCGAQIREDGALPGVEARSSWPVMSLPAFDRRHLEEYNVFDQGVIAHRRPLPEARFDETLPAFVDWELMLRLTARRAPVIIPVVASQYSTGASDRITGTFDTLELGAAVRARAAEIRPLRVLGYNAMFPLLSETYIGDEIEALARCGAEVAFCVAGKRPAPMRVEHPVYRDIDRAIAEFDPDVLVLHWADFTLSSRATLDRIDRPYACRVHSYDADPDVVAAVMADPNCIGVWAYPHLVEQLPGALALPTLFTSHDRLPPAAEERDLVVSVSAGLPKKDWDLLLDAFGRLEGIERRIVIGATSGYEDLPTKLVLRLEELPDPPLLQVNLTRDQVFSVLARSAVLVYTLESGARFGNPSSIVEALCSGVCVVAPDRSEVRELIGPGFRGYRTADDIVDHVREIMAGGPEIDAERARNAAYGHARFADETLAKTFYNELTAAVAVWAGRGDPPSR